MLKSEDTSQQVSNGLMQKINDYKILFKWNLSLLVIFSSTITYALGINFIGVEINWAHFSLLIVSSCLITWAAATLNQVLEKDSDKMMPRTANRPIAAGRIESSHAVFIAGMMSALGIILLSAINPLSAILGTVSLISYVFIYTPLKKVSPIAVWVGAVPGALPMAIGWVAATNNFGLEAIFLFSIQFFWQFPHFWAIAWVAYEDYAKADFYLLPTEEGKDGRNKTTAIQCIIYAAILIPMSVLPYVLGLTGIIACIVMLICALIYTWYAIKLYQECTAVAARKLMFSSFLYLPLTLIVLILDKI